MNKRVLAGTALGGIAGAAIGYLLRAKQIQVPSEFVDLLSRLTLKNITTGDYLMNCKPLYKLDFIKAEDEHKATRIVFGFEDRYGRPESDNDYLDVIVKVEIDWDAKAFGMEITQCGGDAIEVYFDGNLIATFEQDLPENEGQVLGKHVHFGGML